jgi:hypothetical protein
MYIATFVFWATLAGFFLNAAQAGFYRMGTGMGMGHDRYSGPILFTGLAIWNLFARRAHQCRNCGSQFIRPARSPSN